MERKSKLKPMVNKELRVVQEDGRIFCHGQCYQVPAALTNKRVWGVQTPKGWMS